MILKESQKTLIVALSAALPLSFSSLSANAADLGALRQLGEQVFWDKISDPPHMACVTCHDPRAGWTGPHSQTNRTQVAITGANPHTIGNRKPPSNAYASFAPPFQEGVIGPPSGVVGGAFWDGRAKGNIPVGSTADPNKIGDEVFAGTTDPDGLKDAYSQFRGPTAVQALGPFVNPAEQNKADRAGVCRHIQKAKYAPLFEQAWTVPITCDDANVDVNYKRIAVAIAAFQASDKVNSFSSKRDNALANDADKKFPLSGLTEQENLGHDLFYTVKIGPNVISGPAPNGKGANCVVCHNNGRSPFGPNPSDGTEHNQLYTDFSYHNIGTPPNPEIGQFNPTNPDDGLSDTTNDPAHRGFWKTPTLRGVDTRPNPSFVKAYAHNGFFKSLKGIVNFYNMSATVCPPELGVDTEEKALANKCWPAAEHPENTARGGPILGNLGLTSEEEDAIVAYMKTFSDTEIPTKPKPFTPARNK